MLQKITHFLKYNNLTTLFVAAILVGGGSAFAASPELRSAAEEALVGKMETVVQIDNAAFLNIDLETFDPALVITDVSESMESYHVSYTFNILVVSDGAWRDTTKSGILTVSKKILTSITLEEYVMQQLGEVARAEIAFLKEAQTAERAKGQTETLVATNYTGLLGLIIDPKVKAPEPKPAIDNSQSTTHNQQQAADKTNSQQSTTESTPVSEQNSVSGMATTTEETADNNNNNETADEARPSLEVTDEQNASTSDPVATTTDLILTPESASASEPAPTDTATSTELTSTPEVIAGTTIPVITLIGSENIEIEVGDDYTDEGATANDETDGDITNNIVVVNSVNTLESGIYTVTYNVSDSVNNQAEEVTRTITVVEAVDDSVDE